MKAFLQEANRNVTKSEYWAQKAKSKHHWTNAQLYQPKRGLETSTRTRKRDRSGGSECWVGTRKVLVQMLNEMRLAWKRFQFGCSKGVCRVEGPRAQPPSCLLEVKEDTQYTIRLHIHIHIFSRLRADSHFLNKMMTARPVSHEKKLLFCWISFDLLRFADFLTLAPEVDKIIPRSIDLIISGPGSRRLRPDSQFLSKMMTARAVSHVRLA